MSYVQRNGSGIQNRFTRFVLDTYRKIDTGDYEEVAEAVIEGTWKKSGDEYIFDGTVDEADTVYQLKDDLGVGGWRIRFVTLDVVGYSVIERSGFVDRYHREGIILENIDPNKEIDQIHIVELSGHVTGRCSIVDWVRRIPVIRTETGYKMIVRGMPEVYMLLHKEQWFKPLDF